MKQCDLETFYSELAAQLPTRADGYETITLSSENLPLPPLKMATENLYILRFPHFYNNWFRADGLNIYAHKETHRRLGLLILSVIFHRIPKVEIKLNHPHGEIKNLIIEYAYRNIDELTSGYHTQPFAFQYYPRLTYKHPFDKCVSPEDLPCFELSNSTNMSFTDEDWKQRDTVTVFGSDGGLVLFAELLLNLSSPHNDEDEFELEGESGFRGVGVGSAEVKMYLPGHVFWIEEHWQNES